MGLTKCWDELTLSVSAGFNFFCILLCIFVYCCALLCILVYSCALLCIVVYCCLLGLSLRTKKGFFGQKVGGKIEYKDQKLTNFPKKKEDFSGQKNKLGLNFLGKKIGEKIGNNVQKLTNFKEKKKLFGPKKNKLGQSLGKKLGRKLSIKAKN